MIKRMSTRVNADMEDSNWKQRGINSLLDSLLRLGRDILGMSKGTMGRIMGVFCPSSPQYTLFLETKLPYALQYSQIDKALHDRIREAISVKKENLAPAFSKDEEFYINSAIFNHLRKNAEASVKKGECSESLLSKFDWVRNMLTEVTFERKYLKFPMDLTCCQDTQSNGVVSMFQLTKSSRKPITVSDPDTGKVHVIRKPYVDNAEIQNVLRRMLSVGMLRVEDDFIFPTKLGAEIISLYSISSLRRDLESDEEWNYIYAPLLVAKVFESHLKNLQMRRVLSILKRRERQTIFDILTLYGPEGAIQNITWPVWSIPGILSRYGNKLDYRAKSYLYSPPAWEVQSFLETFIFFGWITEESVEKTHDNGAETYTCTLPCYTLTDAGRVAEDIGGIVPEALILMEKDLTYLPSVYPGFRAGLVLEAILSGCTNPPMIKKFLNDLGMKEEDLIIRDSVVDLIRIGYDIRTDLEEDKEAYQLPYRVNVINGIPIKSFSAAKPPFYARKDADRLAFTGIDRRHLILCDLSDRKKLIKNARHNPVELFSVWFADMLKSIGVNCEPFGGSAGPDVVVDHSGYVVFVSVEGAFDERPKINEDKMIRDLTDRSLPFRAFIKEEDRDKEPYYMFVTGDDRDPVASEDTIEKITSATKNSRGAVYGLHELLKIFNEFSCGDELFNDMDGVMKRLFGGQKND